MLKRYVGLGLLALLLSLALAVSGRHRSLARSGPPPEPAASQLIAIGDQILRACDEQDTGQREDLERALKRAREAMLEAGAAKPAPGASDWPVALDASGGIDKALRAVADACGDEVGCYIASEGELWRAPVGPETDSCATYLAEHADDVARSLADGELHAVTGPEGGLAFAPLVDGDGVVVGAVQVVAQPFVLNFGNRRHPTPRECVSRAAPGATGGAIVVDSGGTCMASKGGVTNGRSLIEAKDAEGRLFVAEICDPTSEARKTGWITYAWRNEGDARPRRKVARVAYFEPWDWVIVVSAFEDELL